MLLFNEAIFGNDYDPSCKPALYYRVHTPPLFASPLDCQLPVLLRLSSPHRELALLSLHAYKGIYSLLLPQFRSFTVLLPFFYQPLLNGFYTFPDSSKPVVMLGRLVLLGVLVGVVVGFHCEDDVDLGDVTEYQFTLPHDPSDLVSLFRFIFICDSACNIRCCFYLRPPSIS